MKVSWTIVSIVSRLFSVGIGVIQSYIILSLLTQESYGLIKIVTSVVAMAGVLQNLGISSGSTREISAAKTYTDAGKVFTGSLLVRYFMSIPVAFILIFGSSQISAYYSQPDIAFPLQIFGGILLVQALQSTLTSLVQGLHKFAFLFSHQFLSALVSLLLHIFFLINFSYIGYFYAQFWFNVVSTSALLIYASILLWEHFKLPTFSELKTILKAVFKIGIVVYVIKIIVTQWENLGPLFIGKISDPTEVAVFSAALFIATKVVTISDAVTDVTLPKNTKVFETDRANFASNFLKSNSKAYALILFSAIFIILFKRELFFILDFIFGFINKDPISIKYASSFVFVDPLVIAFWAYSHLNLLKSGISVPVSKPMHALYVFILLISSSIGMFFLFTNYMGPAMSVALSMMFGGILSYFIYLVIIKKSIGFVPLVRNDIMFTAFAVVVLMLNLMLPNYNLIIGIVFVLISLVFIKTSLKIHE